MFDTAAILQPLVDFLHSNPHSAGLIAFFVVFVEAMAVIGVIVPGSITMTAIGVMIGSAVIPAGSTFLWAILGAITGDFISYWLGIHYKDKLHRMWPLNKYPKLLEHSEKFFKHHGGKSVLIGRFVGPMRAMIPMVAGMFSMPWKRFALAAIPSASLWAVMYMLPGVILGALSSELSPKEATQFTLWIFAVLVVVSLILWLIQHFFRQIYRAFDLQVMKLWRYMQQHTVYSWFTDLFADPSEPDSHGQLTLLFGVVCCACGFIVLFYNILSEGVLTALNQPLYHVLSSFRIPEIDKFMTVITIFGDNEVLLPAAGLFLLWLVWRRNWYVAVHWLASIVLGAGTIFVAKNWFFLPRPNSVFMQVAGNSSFPSGHMVLSITLLGFLAVIIARELPEKLKSIPPMVVTALVALIGISRLYLGMHWLTDVFAGIFIGLTILLLVTLSYRRRYSVAISAGKIMLVAIGIFVVTWLVYCLVYFHQEVDKCTLRWSLQSASFQELRAQGVALPLYRMNRLGHPIHALNVEWVGSLNKIKRNLVRRGWVAQQTQLDFPGIIKNLTADYTAYHLPILPQLYHGRAPELMLTKATEQQNVVLVLSLWQPDVKLVGTNAKLFLGSIYYHKAMPKLSYLQPMKNHVFMGAPLALMMDLQNFSWQRMYYPAVKQPTAMQDLDWDGVALLIWPR